MKERIKNIKRIIKYIKITIIHKWFVLVAGLHTKAPLWNLITHDLGKFSPAELPHYARGFYGDGGYAAIIPGWLHHQNRNAHHPEYWMLRDYEAGYQGESIITPLPIPEKYVREMAADWLAAARTYEGSWPTTLWGWKWFTERFWLIPMDYDTRVLAISILVEAGMGWYDK